MASPLIEIEKKKIGFGYPTYFIAEAGLNHNGNVKIAKKMVQGACNAGADAIKFQTYKTEESLTESSQYFKFFKDVELSYEEFAEIKDYSKSVGITFFSSPFDIESASFLKKIRVPCFKIASSDMTNIPLLKHVARMNLPMLISTGLATIHEIDEAVNSCMLEGNSKIALLHCVADYPARPEEVNLAAIESMRKRFNMPIGYSDNGESPLVDLIAVSMGANLIEKHFTLNKKMRGPDHSFSIEPKGLRNLISQIRLVEIMKGDGIKSPKPSEVRNKFAIRKSVTATRKIMKGEILSKEKLAIKRPAEGIEPKYLEEIIGKVVKKNVDKDMPMKWSDLK